MDASPFEPANTEPALQTGLQLMQSHAFDRAIPHLERAFALEPSNASIATHLGSCLMQLKRYAAALVRLDQAIRLDSHIFLAHFQKAIALQAIHQQAQALTSIQQALSLQPDDPLALNIRSQLLITQDPLGSLADAQRVADLLPLAAWAHFNLGCALQRMGQDTQALLAYERTLALEPDFIEALCNKANALRDLGRPREALRCYEQARTLAPHQPMLLWNLSLTMLQLGDYANGWSLYEFRWPTDHQPTKVRPGARLTHTHALAGKSILVYGEQGLGDMIQFCRYLDLLAQQEAQLIVQAPLTLHRLLAQLPGVVQVIAMEAQAPACDYHCPMMSLPLIFQTQLNTIPSHHHPYLSATTDKQHEWRQRLGVSTKRRIGLVVRGQTRNPREHLRSIGLQTLLPFLPSAHEYFLLHQQLHHDDALALSTAPHIHHLSDHIHSMDDTAALCQLMDLVISVDTSVAHLSAALARPTWILLALASDWRWLLQRSDSPWYDSVRLFRQTQQHDWSSVLHEFSTQLAQLDS